MKDQEITLEDFSERLNEALEAIWSINHNLEEMNRTLRGLRWK